MPKRKPPGDRPSATAANPCLSVEEDNPVVGVPVVPEPVRIALPLRTIPVAIGDVPIAVLVAQFARNTARTTASLHAVPQRLYLIRHQNAVVFRADSMDYISLQAAHTSL